MNIQNTQQAGNEVTNAIEDLTINEAATEDVKGGGVFRFAKGGLCGAITQEWNERG